MDTSADGRRAGSEAWVSVRLRPSDSRAEGRVWSFAFQAGPPQAPPQLWRRFVCQAYCRQGGSFTIDLFRLPLGFTVVEQLYSEVPNMRYSGFL